MKKKRFKIIKTIGLIFLFLPWHIPLAAQTIGVSTNALGWATLCPNIGVEVGFAKHWSASADVMANPFTFGNGKRTQVWKVQPEVRYWTRHKFAGHVIGIHGQYGQYDWALKDMRYKGDLKGAGLSYGYAYMLNKHWNIEGYIGLGYNKLDFENRYDRRDYETCFGPDSENYWGITRVGVKLTYFIK